MVGDPAIDDGANVETVAENLACALDEALVCVHMATPEAEDWTWESLIDARVAEQATGSRPLPRPASSC